MKKFLFVSVVIALLIGIILYVNQINEVQINGNDIVSEELIKSDFLNQNNNAVIAYLKYKILDYQKPYLENSKIDITGIGKILLTVNEKKAIGCVRYLNRYVYFTSDGLYIGSSNDKKEDIPELNGVSIKSFHLFQKIDFGNKYLNKRAISISSEIYNSDKKPDSINFDKDGNLSLLYGDVTVNIGKYYYKEKIKIANQLLDQIHEEGVLKLAEYQPGNQYISFERTNYEKKVNYYDGENIIVVF